MRTDYQDPDREPGVESFTPSRLLGCPRQTVLMGQADHYIDIDQAWPMVRGNMIHALMEKASYPHAVATVREKRFATTVMTKYGPQPFTGKADLIVVKSVESVNGVPTLHCKVVDYKSKNEIKHDLTSALLDHQLQVNMYAWLSQKCLLDTVDLGFPPEAVVVVDELEIVYCSMQKVRRFTSAGQLQSPGKMITRNPRTNEMLTLEPITLWPPDKTERFIAAKIEERIDAKEVLPPILEGDAAWRCNYCPIKDYCYGLGNK
jgi:CRISPR/Cas system-associated exonuclease Cas4 (RecB family)